MCIVTKVGRVYLERLIVRPVAVVTVDIVRRSQPKRPRPSAAPARHAATDPDRRRRAWHRSVVGVGSRILVHPLTVEWWIRWDSQAMSTLGCARKFQAKPSHPTTWLSIRPLSGFRITAPYPRRNHRGCRSETNWFGTTAAASVNCRERRDAIFVSRHEDEVGRPAALLAIARMDAVAGCPNAVLPIAAAEAT